MRSGGKVLVTGANGFVGRHLVPVLLERGCDVTCITRSASPLFGAARVFRADLSIPESLLALPRDWDYVIHLAGQSIPGKFVSERDVLENLNTALTLFQHLASGRVLLVSSAHVYTPSREPRTEKSQLRPQGRYGLSKLLIEASADYYRAKLDVRIARPFNHVGPGMRDDLLLPSALRRLAGLKEGEPLVMSGFDSTRDFIDVRDVVTGYLAILDAEPKGGVYNVCTGQGHTIRELIETLMTLMGTKHPILFRSAPTSQDDNPYLVGSPEALRTVTGWAPRFDLKASASSLLDASTR